MEHQQEQRKLLFVMVPRCGTKKTPDKIRTAKTLITAKRQSVSIASHYPVRTSNTIEINVWNMLIYFILSVIEMFADCVLGLFIA